MTISVAPLTTTVMNAVERTHAGVASGINNAVARTAGLLAVAVFGLVMLHNFNSALDRQLATVRISAAAKQRVDDQRFKLAGMTLPATADVATQTALKDAVNSAFIAAFRRVMSIAAVLAFLSAVSAWFMILDDP